jgi:pantoate--beta-alanine ligase
VSDARLVHTITEVRDAVHVARSSGAGVSFVPTMGALHDGHLALMRTAREYGDFVVVSIFVNPLQFGPDEDYARYPRSLDSDMAKLAGLADLVFAPSVDEMYPQGSAATRVTAGPVASTLEGAARPGHFDGMLTVVTKLLNIVDCDTAVFGQKDAQQVFLVRQAVRDLNLQVRVEVAPIVREPDGLALSSRNRYLTAAERISALALSRALRAVTEAARESRGTGTDAREFARIRQAGLEVFAQTPAARLEYLTIVDPTTFTEATAGFRGTALALVAASVGHTRLIDNAALVIGEGAGTARTQDHDHSEGI